MLSISYPIEVKRAILRDCTYQQICGGVPTAAANPKMPSER